MRIALITTTFLPQVGGAEQVVHQLASHWLEQGHDVCVFCEQGENKPLPSDLGYKVLRFRPLRGTYRISPHKFPFINYNVYQLNKALTCFQPDFISAHFGYPIGVWLSYVKRRPCSLVTCHGKDLTEMKRGYRSKYACDQVLATAMNTMSGVIAISTYARDQLEKIGVLPEKIYDIPNGVDVARFSRQTGINIRRKLAIPEEALLILSVGRNSPEKAYENALICASQVSCVGEQVYYLIAGPGVENLASHPCLTKNQIQVILCPGLFGDDLVSAYQQADLFFSASVSELFPLTILEASASGLPLIVTDISGHRDFVEPDVNGKLVDPTDMIGLTEALTRLIRDRPLRESMGRANKQKAQNFTWEHTCRRYLEIAQSLSGGER